MRPGAYSGAGATVFFVLSKDSVEVQGSEGVSPVTAPANFRKREAEYAVGWYDGIVVDIFGEPFPGGNSYGVRAYPLGDDGRWRADINLG